MPWGKPDFFIAAPLQPEANGWGSWNTPVPVKPDWCDDENKKKLFGIELAKDHPSPFMAACAVFAENTSEALWASINWMFDPVVIAAKDLYLKTLETDVTLLDKTQLAARLLKISEEKSPATGKYIIDAKDRLGALQLYAKVMGFGSETAPVSNFTNNEMRITFVTTEKQQETAAPIIEHETNDNVIESPVKVRLVK